MFRLVGQADYRHRVMLPDEIRAQHKMTNTPPEIGLGILRHWLVEVTGEPYQTLYPLRGCEPSMAWNRRTNGYSFRSLGIYAVTDAQVEVIIDTSEGGITAEPTPLIWNEHINQVIGFDVWGMGHNLHAKFEKGDPPLWHMPALPDDVWSVRGAHIR